MFRQRRLDECRDLILRNLEKAHVPLACRCQLLQQLAVIEPFNHGMECLEEADELCRQMRKIVPDSEQIDKMEDRTSLFRRLLEERHKASGEDEEMTEDDDSSSEEGEETAMEDDDAIDEFLEMLMDVTNEEPKESPTTTGQRATTPGPRRNLTNLKGTCYVSTVAQVLHGIPHVRTFVKSPINFRFVQKEDSRGLVEALRDIFQKMDEGGRKLPPAVTENLLGKISSLGNDYGTEAHDATELFEQLLDMLVGTSSATSAGGESARPLEQLAAELECTQRPLKDDAKRSWSGFTHNGRETLLAETLYHQIVRERVCTSCGFIDRLFQQLATVTIESPDGILSPAGKRYDLKELFRDYVLDTAAEEVTDRVSSCPVTTCKSVLGPQTRRIVKTPQVLSFTFRRVLQDFSGQEQK